MHKTFSVMYLETGIRGVWGLCAVFPDLSPRCHSNRGKVFEIKPKLNSNYGEEVNA